MVKINTLEFTVAKTENRDLYDLGHALWSWKLCDDCRRRSCIRCVAEHCPSRRFERLKRFWGYYQGTIIIIDPTWLRCFVPRKRRYIESFDILTSCIAFNPSTLSSRYRISLEFVAESRRLRAFLDRRTFPGAIQGLKDCPALKHNSCSSVEKADYDI